MLLGAVVGAGAPLEAVQAAVDAVGAGPVTLRVETVSRHGLAATRVVVGAPATSTDRTWSDIRSLLERADLVPAVRTVALAAFERLARAEAAVHGGTAEQVHFHEVGGLDAVADIVGTAAGLHALGLDRLTASPVALGLGTTGAAHGVLPVPAPAVLRLLADAGAPVESGAAPYEMCTPTGAALLAASVTEWGGLPPMRVQTVGTGAGARDPAEVPNLLRLVVGTPVTLPTPAGDSALVLAANVDDLDPRLWPHVLARLLAAGASDAWLAPILMKKGRPAYTLSVLVPHALAEEVRRVVFTETSTIGLRETTVAKRALAREVRTVDVDGQPVRVKTARLDGLVVSATPEYDDVVAAAAAAGRPVKAMLAAAVAAASAAGLAP
ncbi:MAG: nickel pincer cofactor biosynthesis protein LarC [Actinomycetota bacterium]|nr:nickel pincer cofactor biosynthesis protein LarC [Actinomycetota bacterium]